MNLGQYQCFFWAEARGGKAVQASSSPDFLLPLVLCGHLPVQSCLCITPVTCRQHFKPSFCKNKLTRSKGMRSYRVEDFPICSVRLFADGVLYAQLLAHQTISSEVQVAHHHFPNHLVMSMLCKFQLHS